MVDTINDIDEDRLRIIHLARKMPGCMIKKVYMWSLFIMQLKFYLLLTTQMQFMLYSLQVNFDDDDDDDGCVTYSL